MGCWPIYFAPIALLAIIALSVAMQRTEDEHERAKLLKITTAITAGALLLVGLWLLQSILA